MKKSMLVLLGVVSFPALAAQVSFTEEGQVVRIEPRIRYVTERVRECWNEEVPVQSADRSRSYGGAIIGSITGGIVGNQVGKGNGKTVATAVGAAIGALAGDNIDNDGHRAPAVQYRTEQRCNSIPQQQERQDGYDVTVRFQGRDIAFQMREDPGYGRIPLNFVGTVTPGRARW